MPPDEDVNVEPSLDDVAATLLVKPEERTPAPKAPKVPVAEDTDDETSEDEDSDNEVKKEVVDEETSDEDTDDTKTDDEEDVDVDELELDVSVDGEEKKVKIKDLKARYSGEGAIEKRLQEASEIRTKAMDLGKHLHANLQAESERLNKLDEILKKVIEPDINWEELKRTNLPKYLLERDKQRENEDRQKAVTAEKERVRVEQERLQAQAHAEYTAEQARLLVAKMPEFADKEKAHTKFAQLTKAAVSYGYAPEEVGGVIDHRAMLVLNDALKYQELMAKKKDVTTKTAPASILLRPGASKSGRTVSTAKKLQDALVKRARATGSADDVAATLMIRKK